MKYLRIVVTVILCVCSFRDHLLSEEPSLPQKLSLVECQKICLKTSEHLSIRDLLTRIEVEKIQQIRGINKPKVSFNADYGMRDNHLGSKMRNHRHPSSEAEQDSNEIMPNARKHENIQDTIKTVTSRKEILTSSTSLIVPIYDSGYVSNRVLSQENLVDVSRYSRDRLEQKLLNEVAQSYYFLLESRKLEEVILQSLETLRNELETTADLFSIGYVTENDVLVIEVQLCEREQELIQARNNGEIAFASLNRLMGQDLNHFFDIEDVSEVVEWHNPYGFFEEKADKLHPDLKRITSEKSANRFDYKAIQAENRPKINGIVSYNTSSNPFLLHRHWMFGGIGIQIPILDGGIVESKLKQKEDEIESLDLSFASKKEDIHLDIRRFFLRTRAAWTKIPVSKKAIRSAEETLRMTSEQYQEGLVSSDDLLNNEERLARARSNYYQTLYQFHMAKSELEFAAGIISF